MLKKIIIAITFIFYMYIVAYSQETILPGWGVNAYYGRTVSRPDMGLSPQYITPLSWKWRYSSIEIYKIWYLKNLSFYTGITLQSNKYLYILMLPVSTYGYGYTGRVPLLGYLQINYNFLQHKSICPYVGGGLSSSIINFNTLIGEVGLRYQPKYELPLYISVQGRFTRTYSKQPYDNYPYLDNAALGISIQYKFRSKKKGWCHK